MKPSGANGRRFRAEAPADKANSHNFRAEAEANNTKAVRLWLSAENGGGGSGKLDLGGLFF